MLWLLSNNELCVLKHDAHSLLLLYQMLQPAGTHSELWLLLLHLKDLKIPTAFVTWVSSRQSWMAYV